MNLKKYLLIIYGSVIMIEHAIAVDKDSAFQLVTSIQQEDSENIQTNDYFSYLPNELINEIVRNLHSPEDKLRFMRSCKRNRAAVLRNITDEKSTIKLVYNLDNQEDLEKLKLYLIERADERESNYSAYELHANAYTLRIEASSNRILAQIINNPDYNFEVVKNLSLFMKKIEDTNVQAIINSPNMKNLTSLDLSWNNIKDTGVTEIAKLSNLESLNLKGNSIKDAGAIEIAKLSNLKNLNLGNNMIRDTGATEIAKLTNLENLNLGSNIIKDAGATEIAKLSNLTSLDLSSNIIKDAGATEIAKLSNLTSLDLSSNIIKDAGAIEIAKLSNLTSLNLSDNIIGDAGATEVAKLNNLTSLDLRGNDITNVTVSLLTKRKLALIYKSNTCQLGLNKKLKNN